MEIIKVEGRKILIVGLVTRNLEIGVITSYYLGYDPRGEHTITIIEIMEGASKSYNLGNIISEGRIEEWDLEYQKRDLF